MRTYHGVKLVILNHIETLGDQAKKLPPERYWCDLLNVSRSSVRLALQALETEGRIQRKRGSGWYVSASPLLFDPCNHVPFTFSAIQQGRKPSWREISTGKTLPPAEIASDFGIRSNRKVPTLGILLELDSVSVGFEFSYLNPAICSDPAKIDHNLPISDELRRISGSPLLYPRMSIKSTNCGAYAADLMGVHAESPALLMKQWISSENGTAVAVIETIWRANALEFVVEQSETEIASRSP